VTPEVPLYRLSSDTLQPAQVTSLTAKAVSFFSPSLVGCEKGQSSPEDVAGGVFLGVGLVPTADASEHRLLTRFSLAPFPQASQRSEVCRGSTSIICRKASSALAEGSRRTVWSLRRRCFRSARSWPPHQ